MVSNPGRVERRARVAQRLGEDDVDCKVPLVSVQDHVGRIRRSVKLDGEVGDPMCQMYAAVVQSSGGCRFFGLKALGRRSRDVCQRQCLSARRRRARAPRAHKWLHLKSQPIIGAGRQQVLLTCALMCGCIVAREPRVKSDPIARFTQPIYVCSFATEPGPRPSRRWCRDDHQSPKR